MGRIDKDTLSAIFLLVVCGIFIAASFDIRETQYGTPGSELWPRVVLTLLTLLCLGYLIRSVRRGSRPRGEPRRGLRAWLASYANALWCYLFFALFLVSLPTLGMLVASSLFVFATLSALGRGGVRAVALHAAVAVGSVGLMWALFTYGLRVMLPEGALFSAW
jgi:hypothetical protein